MSDYATLLVLGTREVREFERTAPEAKMFQTSWLESLAVRMERASSLSDGHAVEREIEAIARSIVDSGPMESSFAPSFFKALDALQRARKKRNA
jgi:hypothetical protein